MKTLEEKMSFNKNRHDEIKTTLKITIDRTYNLYLDMH